MRVVIAIVSALALTASVVGEAAPPRISVSPAPKALQVGQGWDVAVSVRGARPTRFVVRLGERVARFPLVRSGRRFHAYVMFPAPGRWRYGVRLGNRDRFVGSILVRAAVPELQQPYGIVEEAGGSLLVADHRSSAILRLHPSTGNSAVVARVPFPRDLRPAGNGKLLVSSGRTVIELDPRTRELRHRHVLPARLEGIAPAPGGGVYAVEGQSRVVRVEPGGARTVLVEGLNGVHGILATPGGLVVCESFAGNVLLVTVTGTRTLASGLGNPSYAAPAPGGGVYVTEFSADRISLVEPSGFVRAVAAVERPGPLVLDAQGRLLVGSVDGRISRVDPATGRVGRVWPRR